jgi:hypothetical protein
VAALVSVLIFTALSLLVTHIATIGAPHDQTTVYEDDTLLLYGREAALAELDYHPDTAGGDQAHRKAAAAQQNVVQEQNRKEAQREREKER